MKFSDPFKILSPNERWAPTQSQMDSFQNAYEKLLPPLVYKIRLAVAQWRDEDYQGASDIAHEYKTTGKYKVIVKVVDILGIDTSKIIEVKI